MIKDNTLLIIGAGTSCSYGYPSGAKLREHLIDLGNMQELLDEYGVYIEGAATRFCQEFRLSELKSIDSFLAKRGNEPIILQSGQTVQLGDGKNVTYGDYGKLAIAAYLVSIEIETASLESPKDDHWFQYLWNSLADDATLDTFKENRLSIVTFNYDRLIERYFQRAILGSYGANDNSLPLLNNIEIVHVYGSLQSLEARPYGIKPSSIRTVANSIKVIPEVRDDNSEEFTRAKELISWADRVCFLGFGFDPLNVSRLGFPEHSIQNKKVYFSKYEMMRVEALSYLRSLGFSAGLAEQYLAHNGFNSNHKSLGFFRESGALLP